MYVRIRGNGNTGPVRCEWIERQRDIYAGNAALLPLSQGLREALARGRDFEMAVSIHDDELQYCS